MVKFIFGIALLMLTGCTEQSLKNQNSHGLIYCAEANPVSFNPQITTSGSTIDLISNQLYNRLISIDANTGEFLPELAKSWKISKNRKKITFELRQDVQFHHTDYFTPSRNFDADDVVFTFSRLFDVYNPYHFVSGGQYPYFKSIGLDRLIKSIIKESQYSVSFELFDTQSSFLSNMATDFSVILSAEYAKSLEVDEKLENLDHFPIGTGPYKFKDYKRDILIRYYQHEKYWQHPVALAQLVYDITPNSTTRIAKMLTHECDVTPHPNSSQLSILADRKDIQVQKETNLNMGYWAFNTQKAPFNNGLVRRALAHAIDVNKIMQSVFLNNGKRLHSILPSTSWAYQAQVNMPDYNPELAKRLLRQAGIVDGFSMDLWAMPVARIYNPNARKMAELIQNDLKKIDVTVHIVEYEWNTFIKKLEDHTHDSVLLGWSADTPDPDNFFSPLLSCAAALSGKNSANWCDPEFDLLLSNALDTVNIDERKEYYFQAQQMVIQELPLLPIAQGMRFQATSSNVKDIEIKPFGGVSLAKARKE
ncbi:ABC transporter substrate-binding protein [Pseudoalteromonas denitrificans]|uniref:Cationic peptide transport system substrate-binding protein n=1 Tax=Pseudoalteromonas denitrificans DSM 6059 TaxID=1123010 RepID=A0A1I1MMP4_9GAMM|nr:ABC transporter substrate-binding protein [Pseudoalteromonas denitrificans]SFC86405.1 cationic peptide transport system substrate-binding protein [Pseudoalteromonas denitrificans DSM 6059]